MPTVTIRRVMRIVDPVKGIQGFLVDGEVLTAALESVTAADLGLRTITSEPELTSRERSYVFYGSTSRPGSPGNYFVPDIDYIATAGAPVRATGSHSAGFKVVGE